MEESRRKTLEGLVKKLSLASFVGGALLSYLGLTDLLNQQYISAAGKFMLMYGGISAPDDIRKMVQDIQKQEELRVQGGSYISGRGHVSAPFFIAAGATTMGAVMIQEGYTKSDIVHAGAGGLFVIVGAVSAWMGLYWRKRFQQIHEQTEDSAVTSAQVEQKPNTPYIH